MTKVVERNPQSPERTYLLSIVGGLQVTWKHFTSPSRKGKPPATGVPGGKVVVQRAIAALRVPGQGRDGDTARQLPALREPLPAQAIKITPPGPDGVPAGQGQCEKMSKELRSTCSGASSGGLARKSARREGSSAARFTF